MGKRFTAWLTIYRGNNKGHTEVFFSHTRIGVVEATQTWLSEQEEDIDSFKFNVWDGKTFLYSLKG